MNVFLLVFHQRIPPTFFRGTNIFRWCCNTLEHTDSGESRNFFVWVSPRKHCTCTLNKHSSRSQMKKPKKIWVNAKWYSFVWCILLWDRRTFSNILQSLTAHLSLSLYTPSTLQMTTPLLSLPFALANIFRALTAHLSLSLHSTHLQITPFIWREMEKFISRSFHYHNHLFPPLVVVL